MFLFFFHKYIPSIFQYIVSRTWPPRSRDALRTRRPIRPNPLIPILLMLSSLQILENEWANDSLIARHRRMEYRENDNATLIAQIEVNFWKHLIRNLNRKISKFITKPFSLQIRTGILLWSWLFVQIKWLSLEYIEEGKAILESVIDDVKRKDESCNGISGKSHIERWNGGGGRRCVLKVKQG